MNLFSREESWKTSGNKKISTLLLEGRDTYYEKDDQT